MRTQKARGRRQLAHSHSLVLARPTKNLAPDSPSGVLVLGVQLVELPDIVYIYDNGQCGQSWF